MNDDLIREQPIQHARTGDSKKQTDLEYDTEPIAFHSKKMREYIQFIFWMIKDFGWCLYWAPLSIPVCLCTLSIQLCVVYFDSCSPQHLILNFSELCWLVGNTCWMFGDMLWSTEETSLKISNPPLIQMSEKEYHRVVRAALGCFCIGLIPSVSYIFYRLRSRNTRPFNMDDYHILIIMCWIVKDMSWSYYNLRENLLSKMFGCFFGSSAFLTAFYMVYISRDFIYTYWLNLQHTFWILGNLLWMTSEFQSIDPIKICAIASFSLGLMVSLYMAVTIVYPDIRIQYSNYRNEI